MIVTEGRCCVHFVSGQDIDRLTELFAQPYVSSTGVLTWDIPAFITLLNTTARRS
jgi:hypothetical protein